MNPLLVGCGIAAVLAGPSLYAQVESGGLDGTTALLRYAVVALICAIGVSLIMNIMRGYEKDWEQKDAQEARENAQAAAEAEARRAAEEAEARRAAQRS